MVDPYSPARGRRSRCSPGTPGGLCPGPEPPLRAPQGGPLSWEPQGRPVSGRQGPGEGVCFLPASPVN